MTIRFLGTGTSHGVPMLDCVIDRFERCPKMVCKKALSQRLYRRSRSSILVEYQQKVILFDVSADFREQAIRENITRIDAVVLTHSHADHIGGIPDIRSYTKDQPLTVYGSHETLQMVKSTFSYIFDPSTFVGGGIPQLHLCPIDAAFSLFGLEIVPVGVEHGNLTGCYGYRFGDVVYIPDMKRLHPGQESLLGDARLLILNCLRIDRPHPSHLILSESVDLATMLHPKQCRFTHMSHDIDFDADSERLPAWCEFAYDGEVVSV